MIVAFTGQKGGVGKSTTAIALAAAGLERGLRVLLVDADPQGTSRTWGEVAAEAGHPTPLVVAMGSAMHKPDQLPALAKGYDLTVIDCPPRHGDVQRSALMVAHVAVLPCGPSAADAWAMSASIELVREAQVLREALQACVLITRKQGRTALGKGAREVLAASGLPLLTTELHHRVAYQEAIAAGLGPTGLAPRDAAATEIRALFEELENVFHGKETSGCYVAQAAAG